MLSHLSRLLDRSSISIEPVTGLNRLEVGIGMVPRGEVDLIFASLGLSQGIIDAGLYAVTVAVVLLTTVITPRCSSVLWRCKKKKPDDLAASARPPASV